MQKLEADLKMSQRELKEKNMEMEVLKKKIKSFGKNTDDVSS